MNRTNQILIAVLVVQIALGVFTFWPQSTVAEAGQPLLGELTAADVVALTLSDNDDNQITLAKEGADWVLPERGNFPVNSDRVSVLLEQLEKVQSGRLVTETEGSHSQLQVAEDNFNRRLELTGQDGSKTTLYLGSSGGPSANHVRANDQAEVYLTGEISAFDANPQAANWIETLYFTQPQSTTVTITLENENGTFAFEKTGEDWVMKGLAEDETLDPNGISTLLNQSHSIRLLEPVGLADEAGAALDDPIATVLIETADQISYSLQVGPQDSEDNSYLFKASDSPYTVRVSQFTGDNLVNKTRADFLQAPQEEIEGGITTDPE